MKTDPLLKQLEGVQMPRHVGVIMDGNGRWAKKRFLPRSAGHREGANTFGKIARFARDCGVDVITFYTFSMENWSRPDDEVNDLMELLHKYLRESYKYEEENIKTCFIGELEALSDTLREEIREVEQASGENTGITVNIALNYGGRDELVAAARRLAQEVLAGKLRPEDIDKDAFAARLYTAGMPECDVIIRPSGEQRLSNFLLWQGAYAEFIFMDVLWPDFSEADFTRAMLEYSARNRRFGGL